MTPSKLKAQYEANNPNGKYFKRENMKFSGDTMANYKVLDDGDTWMLCRKKPVNCGLNNTRHFSKKDFSIVFGK